MHDTKFDQTRAALLALLSGGTLIGCSPILVRLSELGPVSTAFWQLALALIPLLLFSAREAATGTEKPRTPRDALLVSLPGFLLAAELTSWHISLHMTSVANATLLVNIAPIFVSLYCWLFLRQRPSRLFVVALSITIAGLVILKSGSLDFGGGDLKGDVAAIFAAMLYAAYILALAKMRGRFSTSTIMIWSSCAGALSIVPFARFSEPAQLPVTMVGWTVLFALSWLSQAGGQSLITYALAWSPATLSSLTLLLQPVVAAILAWFVMGEVPSLWQGIGGSIVLVGIWTARRVQN
ncbi:DMT family transporter [Bradyrhizobium sp. BR 1432]|uniref:DMT family transporter n=1 Tax=Bradyrhizobium sp. BR 1432 TaxID=3447966 RepID=UPI003EE6E6F9